MSSIDDLTAQVDQQGFFSLAQQRVLSLSGLVPSGPVGSMYRYDGERSPFTAIGVSDRVHVRSDAQSWKSRRTSYRVMREIDYGGNLETLAAIRAKLIEVRFKASEVIRARLERMAAANQKDGNGALETKSSNVKTAQTSFDSAWKEAIESIQTAGVMVIRTEQSRSDSLAGKIGAVLGLGANEDREVGGFAILAGLRTTFLFVGDDLGEDYWAQPLSRDWNLIGSSFPFIVGSDAPWIGQFNYENIQIVTAKLEAKHVLYVRDQITEAKVQANLKASVDQLKDLKGTLDNVDEVAIDSVLKSVEGLGNVGILGTVVEWTENLDGTTVSLVPASAASSGSNPDAAPPRSSASWQTVYQVLTDYDDLRSLADGNPRLHLTNLN